MCLIIHSPVGHIPSAETIRSALHYNSDGVGFMYFDKKVQVIKHLKADFQTIHDTMEALKNREYAVHFRMRTHGEIDDTNVHPFRMKNGGWLMHNGILSIRTDTNEARSDTWHYVKQKLDPIRKIDWRHVEKDIGRSNKFVILSKDGKFEILNKSTGVDYEGAWYSNTYAWDYPLDWYGSYNRRDYWDFPASNDEEYQPLFDAVVDGLAAAIWNGKITCQLATSGVYSYEELVESLDSMHPADLAPLVTEFFSKRA